MNGSIDKLTVQLGFIFVTYMFTYIVIFLLGEAAHGLRSILYGFNFLFGVIIGSLISMVIGGLKKRNVIKKEYINTFLMKRISGFFFDMMIVAGVAAIKIDMIKDYWLMLLVLAFVGAFSTYKETIYGISRGTVPCNVRNADRNGQHRNNPAPRNRQEFFDSGSG